MSTITFTEEDLNRILLQKVGIDPDTLEGAAEPTLEDLGLDSLAALEIQTIVKDAYGVELPENTVEMTTTEVVSFVHESLTRRVVS